MKKFTTNSSAIFLVIVLAVLRTGAPAQEFDGYVLFNPNGSRDTYLVDSAGKTVHEWNHSTKGGYGVYLLENGNLLRPAVPSNNQFREKVGGTAGMIQEIDPDGKVVWEFKYESATKSTHHDIEPMPNGNILIIAVDVKPAADALANGFETSSAFLNDHILEVNKQKEIVWEWHAWDHIVQEHDKTKMNYGVVAEHPELLDINLGSGGRGGAVDWLHSNGISYNAEKDLIVFSSHNLDEIFVIDHSTTKEEVKGHTGGKYNKGGDILYRWGKPSNHGASGTQYLHMVHSGIWVPAGAPGAGNLMAYNNGSDKRASSILEVAPLTNTDGSFNMTAGSGYSSVTPTWSYSDNGFYSQHLGFCLRMPNGNTFMIESTDNGKMREVTKDGKIIWEHNPGKQVARGYRYPSGYPGVAKLNPSGISVMSSGQTIFSVAGQAAAYRIPEGKFSQIKIQDMSGRIIRQLRPTADNLIWDGLDKFNRPVTPGIYIVSFNRNGSNRQLKIVVSR